MAKTALKAVKKQAVIKLDLGCGKNKKEGFLGVDQRKFPGVDVVTDLNGKWPWKDGTVEEISASHIIEHFTGKQRVHIFNEMYRVLREGATVTIITPHWNSNRAYGDFTHQWPPVSEFLYFYVNRNWRRDNAPDNDIEWNPDGYSCHFEGTIGYGGLHEQLRMKNTEVQNFAMTFYKEAVGDIVVTLTKKPY
jgi:hypothetical protein